MPTIFFSLLSDSKNQFIAARGYQVVAATVVQLVLITNLALSDIAKIGFVDSVIAIACTALSFGINVALAREVAKETDSTLRTRLVRWTIQVQGGFGVIVALAIAGVASILILRNTQSTIGLGLLVTCFAIPTILLTQAASTSMSAVQDYRSALTISWLNPSIRLVLIPFSVILFGVKGYFFAILLAQLAIFIVAVVLLTRRFAGVLRPRLEVMDRSLFSRLWVLSKFGYLNTLSTELWLRSYVWLSVAFLPGSAAGAVVFSLSVSRRLSLVGEAVTAVSLPRLTRYALEHPTDFHRAARREVVEVTGLHTIFTLVFAVLWVFVGEYLVGQEKFASISSVLYWVLVAQVFYVATVFVTRCELIPISAVEGVVAQLSTIRVIGIGFAIGAINWLSIDASTATIASLIIASVTSFGVTAYLGEKRMQVY